MGAKGWHSRGYLPHYDGPGVIQHVVFHLHDAAPEAGGDDVLDRGLGCALLRDEDCARIVCDALIFDDPGKYALHAWCVMPNHVHVLLMAAEDRPLGQIVREWKTITAKRINQRLGRTGSIWAADYFDRYIRDEAHYQSNKLYIERNPVAAGLCDRPEDWRFSSAGWKKERAPLARTCVASTRKCEPGARAPHLQEAGIDWGQSDWVRGGRRMLA